MESDAFATVVMFATNADTDKNKYHRIECGENQTESAAAAVRQPVIYITQTRCHSAQVYQVRIHLFASLSVLTHCNWVIILPSYTITMFSDLLYKIDYMLRKTHKFGIRFVCFSILYVSSLSVYVFFCISFIHVLLNMGTSLDGLIALLVCLQCSCE